MERTTFQWRRFWCTPDGSIVLGDDGFLADPEGEYGRIINPDVQPVNLLADTPCLVLLGEPGIGKSTTLEAERASIESRLAASGQAFLWVDLHEVGTDAQLSRRLFDSPKFSAWKQGDEQFTVFLDSLDECRVQINTLPSLLINELRECPIERLHVRIACRTADWSPTLERGLRELWGNDAVCVVELAPLRRSDVKVGAATLGLDPDTFVDAVMRSGVVPLAIKPLTLDFLLRTFRRHGTLLIRQADLYREGCRLLCIESERRHQLRLPRLLEADQRLALAERIAALTVFANRAAVATGINPGDVLADDLALRDLSSGSEVANGDSFAVTEDGVAEALNTGLFSSRGEHRLGWAHRTYAEFLSARYVIEHGMSLPQVLSLITHPTDPEGKLVPQLHGVSAWLSSMRADVFHAVLEREPEVLLRSDVNAPTNEDRAALVSVLLQACEAGDWIDRDWGLHQRYALLRHPTLAEQLSPYISDAGKGDAVRRVAINIAVACEERSLSGDLVGVALNSDTPVHTRVNAAYAVISIGDDASRGSLGTLINTPTELDPDAELKGCGLQATWPRLLPTSELLGALTPSRTNFLGAYRSFLLNDPIQHMPVRDLPLALEWAKRQVDQESVPSDIEHLVNAIMHVAWDHLGDSSVLDGFSAVAWTRIRHAQLILDPSDTQLLQQNIDRRRLAVTSMVATVDDHSDLGLLAWSELLMPSDTFWLLNEYQLRPDTEKKRWGQLIRHLLHYDDRAAVESALTARESDPGLRRILAPIFDPIPLDSEKAARLAEQYQRGENMRQRLSRKEPLLQPSPSERVAALLTKFERGDRSAWWHLNRVLTLEPSSARFGDDYESDLTRLPGWRDATLETRGSIVMAANRYVCEVTPDPDQWIASGDNNRIFRPDWAGFRALRLLLTEAPGLLAALSTDVWVRWTPVVIGYPTLNPSERDAAHQHLSAHAYQHAPEEVLSTLNRLIDAEQGREHESADRVLWRIDDCWDERLAALLLNKIQQRNFSPNIMGQLLEALLSHGTETVAPIALSLIPTPLPTDEEDRTRAMIAAVLLLRHAADKGWSIFFPAMQRDQAFATGVLARLVWHNSHIRAVGAKLTDEQIGDLYIWLSQQYPPAEDPYTDGIVKYRTAVGQWRDHLLTQLQLRGTERACREIERISSALPDQPWLTSTLLEVKALARQRTWAPPQPEDIRTLASSNDVRVVQNADQLLDVVVESLQRLELRLQLADPPRAVELWNEVQRNIFRPRDEERLSDYVKGHLDDDLRERGIVSNREVVNRRGEETDIRVEALPHRVLSDEMDPLTIIVEVKGCWHDELESAMETQLVDRYLSDTKISHGLYVVGWYNCDKWDPDDRRNKRAPRYDRSEAHQRFDVQAAELSRGGKHIRALVLDISLKY